MTDEIDNTEWGIDRRTVLKGVGTVSAAGLIGVPALSGSAAASLHTETTTVVSDTDTKVTRRRAGTSENEPDCAFTDLGVDAKPTYEVDPWSETTACFDGSDADWIWYSTEDKAVSGSDEYYVLNNEYGDVVEFERTFRIDGAPVSGTLSIAVDNGFEAYINGHPFATKAVNDGDEVDWECSNLELPYVETDGWRTDGDCDNIEYPVPVDHLIQGENTLTVLGVNAHDREGADDLPDGRNPAGLIYELNVEYAPACEVPLYAGQDIDVGTVTSVLESDSELSVTYETDDDWYLTETHLEVVDDKKDFPTAGRNNNPKVGQFSYGDSYGPGVQTATFDVDVNELSVPYYIAAHAVVYHVDCGTAGDPSFWASSVADYDLGTQKDGDSIPDDRDDPLNALGAPDGDFVSLGFDDPETELDDPGYVVFEFDDPVYNSGDDADVFLQEVTFGRDSYPEELADVYVSPVGEDTFIHAGQISNKDSYDGNAGLGAVGIPDGIVAVDAVKVVDATDPDNFEGDDDADGYDLDAVGADCLVDQEETAWGDGCPFTERGNWATYTVFNPDGDKCGCPEE